MHFPWWALREQNPDGAKVGKEGEILCLSCMTSSGPGTAVCAALVPFGRRSSLRLYSLHFQLIEEENEAENRKLISSGLLWQEISTGIDPTSLLFPFVLVYPFTHSFLHLFLH